jgi:hypothetical protein
LYEYETLFLTLREQNRAFQNRVLMRIFRPKRKKRWEAGEDCKMRNFTFT